jgi:hypothetical protein
MRVKPLAECSDSKPDLRDPCYALKKVAACRHLDWQSGKLPLCFVRTDRAAQSGAGARLTRFGNDLLFIVDLPPEALETADLRS